MGNETVLEGFLPEMTGLPDKPMFMAKLKHFVTSFKDLKLLSVPKAGFTTKRISLSHLKIIHT